MYIYIYIYIYIYKVVLVAKSIIYTSFLRTSFFTKSLSLFKLTGTDTNLSTSSLSTLLFKLLKLFDTFFNLSVSNLSLSDFKLAKSVFLAKDDDHFLNLLSLHN